MKKLLLVCLMTLSIVTLRAQDEDKTEFTDAELISYATVMVWAEGEKEKLTEQYNSWIKDNEAISSAKFSELNDASKAGKLEEVEATEEELAAFKKIQEKNDEQLANFKEVYVGKIKEEITVSLYNDLNKAMKKDAALKERYNKIFNELLEAAQPGEETANEDSTAQEASGS